MSKAELRQVRQLLDLDDGVVQGGLQALGHHVGQDYCHHHGQDVGDLACQLKADNRRRHSVSHSPGQSCRSCQRHGTRERGEGWTETERGWEEQEGRMGVKKKETEEEKDTTWGWKKGIEREDRGNEHTAGDRDSKERKTGSLKKRDRIKGEKINRLWDSRRRRWEEGQESTQTEGQQRSKENYWRERRMKQRIE